MGFIDNEKKVMATNTLNGWDADGETQVRAWMRTAQLNSAINELAALYYTKLHRAALLAVSILTIIVGSRGVATIITGGATAADIVISVCEIALGICASLLSNMELKTKSVSFGKRAMGYSRLASVLRVQLVLRPEERQHKTDFLQGIPERVEYLDDMAEPLPLRYRHMAEHSATGGILNMWSSSATAETAHPPHVPHESPLSQEMPYDGKHDEEGTTSCIIRTIIQQRL